MATRSVASTSFYGQVQDRMLQVLNFVADRQMFCVGHRLGGSTVNQLAVDYYKSAGADPNIVFHATRFNSYLDREFRQQPYQTVYSTRDDYVSGGDDEILWRSPHLKILDGDVIEAFQSGRLILGKHSIALMIEHSETQHPWLTKGDNTN